MIHKITKATPTQALENSKRALNSTSILARSNPETTSHSLKSYIQQRALLETITEVF
jgi:hypothetical protein